MAVEALDFATPLFDRVEYHIDKRKSFGLAVTTIAVSGLIAYPILSHPNPLVGIAETLAAIVAFAGSVVLLVVGIGLALRALAYRGAALVIDAQGIHDRRAGSRTMPWTHIRDIRVLDRHGRHIGIETLPDPERKTLSRRSWLPAICVLPAARHVTLIDTFFLEPKSGDRVLDFILPITAMAPVEMSETPVSAETLSADARLSRTHRVAVVLFILIAAVIPAAAAISIAP